MSCIYLLAYYCSPPWQISKYADTPIVCYVSLTSFSAQRSCSASHNRFIKTQNFGRRSQYIMRSTRHETSRLIQNLKVHFHIHSAVTIRYPGWEKPSPYLHRLFFYDQFHYFSPNYGWISLAFFPFHTFLPTVIL